MFGGSTEDPFFFFLILFCASAPRALSCKSKACLGDGQWLRRPRRPKASRSAATTGPRPRYWPPCVIGTSPLPKFTGPRRIGARSGNLPGAEMGTPGAWPLVADRARPSGRGVGSPMGIGCGAEAAAPPALSLGFRGRLGTPAPIRSTRRALRAGPGGRRRRRRGPGRAGWSLTPPPGPRAGLAHKCWDSHGPACSSAAGPGTRGPGDAADTEGFVDTVTPALPL